MKIPKNKKEKGPEDNRALELLIETIKMNSGIPMSNWIGASICLIIGICLNSGDSYEEFCKKMDSIKKNSKDWWDDKNG